MCSIHPVNVSLQIFRDIATMYPGSSRLLSRSAPYIEANLDSCTTVHIRNDISASEAFGGWENYLHDWEDAMGR